MADNEIVEIIQDDNTEYLSDAPTQVDREFFTPGERTPVLINQTNTLAMNWPSNTDFPIKTGVPVVDNLGREYDRVYKLGRNIICDQTIPAPEIIAVHNREMDDNTGAYHGEYVYTETETEDNNGSKERNTGWNAVKE